MDTPALATPAAPAAVDTAERFSLSIPRIGAPLAGGVFHGIVFKEDGSPDYLLITGPEAETRLSWNAATLWASTQRAGGFDDWTLPDRRDTAVQFANARGAFKTDDYYWTREQLASVSAYAWGQDFNYGDQGCWRKDSEGRVRAVRRLPIQ